MSQEDPADEPSGDWPPAVLLGLGGVVAIFGGAMVAIATVSIAIELMAPGQYPFAVRAAENLAEEEGPMMFIGPGLFLLAGYVIFKRGLTQIRSGATLGSGLARGFARMIEIFGGIAVAILAAAAVRNFFN